MWYAVLDYVLGLWKRRKISVGITRFGSVDHTQDYKEEVTRISV